MKTNTILVVFFKSFKLIKLIKSVKVLKMGFSFMSMAVFTACHSVAMGIYFALALVLLLFIHELGHILALRKLGVPTKLPVFIPFLGAVIFCPPFKSRHKEAYVGFGGPALGTVAAVAFAIPAMWSSHPAFWLTGSLLGVGLNLFNMLPVSPLDGGRITQAIHPWFKLAGWVLLITFTIFLGEPGMLIIWIAAIGDIKSLGRKTQAHLGLLTWVVMVALTACGVGKQDIANCVDCILGAGLVCLLMIAGYHDKLKDIDKKDNRTQLGWKKKRYWCARFFLLFLLQAIVIAVLVTIIHSLQ